MNPQKTIGLTSICVGLFFSVLLLSVQAKCQSPDSLQWGTIVDGLQMSVSIADSHKADVPELQFIIRNTGEKDTILNLGMMLANGKVQLPDRIGFNLADVNGKTRKFDFFDGKFAVVAGRVDDYIVPLRSGSMYGLKIGLDKFYSSSTNEIGSKLPSGRYQITAQFEGDGAEVHELIINSWKGKLQSNTLTIEK
ncbi:MAG: hypothetical protein M3033_05180 [Acidobacteriota bacterium]|nr:hypothetical protein [Acidobacteriota bacterium]